MTTEEVNPHSLVSEGISEFAGIGIHRLAEQVGRTPFFAYDRTALAARVATIKSTLPARLQLSYAVKANPMPALVSHIAGLVDGFDVASAGEMRVALDAGMPATRVSFAGPGKTDAELRSAIASGVTIEIESSNEARRVVSIGHKLAVKPRVAVRVNPDFEVRGSGMRMGGGPQQFGVDAEQVPELLSMLDGETVDVLGFHVFAGSQNLNSDILCDAQRKTVDLVVELSASARQPIRYVNLGGGFGIPYFPKDVPLDLGPIAANLELLTARLDSEFPDARLAVELGRYIVGEAGIYVTRIVDRKESRGRTFLVVDGGLHHQLAASGNFGQVIRKNYPVTVARQSTSSAAKETAEPVSVVGCLCTPLDLLGDDMTIPHGEVGDLVVIFQAGAYGLTASPTAFLGHEAPAEVLL